MIANCLYYQYLLWPASPGDIHPLEKQINNSLKISLFFSSLLTLCLPDRKERER